MLLAGLGSAAATVGWWLLGWKLNDIQAWWFWPLAVVHVLVTLMLGLTTWAFFLAATEPSRGYREFDLPRVSEVPPPPPSSPKARCCHHHHHCEDC